MPNESKPASGQTGRILRWVRWGAAWVALVLVVTFLPATARDYATPPTASQDYYQGAALNGAAPDFQLVDQLGVKRTLSGFRGRIVVLTFLDSKCRDVCPLTAGELRKAYRSLGTAAESAIFLGVNVNTEANSVADVKAASVEWHLDEVPTLHFLTGSPEELERVWKAYGIAVFIDPNGTELVHTSGVFVIDRSGQERWYVSVSFDELGTPPVTRPLSDLLVQHIWELLNER